MSHRPSFTTLIVIGLMTISPVSSHAAQLYHGEVRALDPDQGKITLKHEPLPKLGMDEGMTMVYRVADPLLLKHRSVGERVLFDVEKENGHFVVTHMEKAK